MAVVKAALGRPGLADLDLLCCLIAQTRSRPGTKSYAVTIYFRRDLTVHRLLSHADLMTHLPSRHIPLTNAYRGDYYEQIDIATTQTADGADVAWIAFGSHTDSPSKHTVVVGGSYEQPTFDVMREAVLLVVKRFLPTTYHASYIKKETEVPLPVTAPQGIRSIVLEPTDLETWSRASARAGRTVAPTEATARRDPFEELWTDLETHIQHPVHPTLFVFVGDTTEVRCSADGPFSGEAGLARAGSALGLLGTLLKELALDERPLASRLDYPRVRAVLPSGTAILVPCAHFPCEGLAPSICIDVNRDASYTFYFDGEQDAVSLGRTFRQLSSALDHVRMAAGPPPPMPGGIWPVGRMTDSTFHDQWLPSFDDPLPGPVSPMDLSNGIDDAFISNAIARIERAAEELQEVRRGASTAMFEGKARESAERFVDRLQEEIHRSVCPTTMARARSLQMDDMLLRPAPAAPMHEALYAGDGPLNQAMRIAALKLQSSGLDGDDSDARPWISFAASVLVWHLDVHRYRQMFVDALRRRYHSIRPFKDSLEPIATGEPVQARKRGSDAGSVGGTQRATKQLVHARGPLGEPGGAPSISRDAGIAETSAGHNGFAPMSPHGPAADAIVNSFLASPLPASPVWNDLQQGSPGPTSPQPVSADPVPVLPAHQATEPQPPLQALVYLGLLEQATLEQWENLSTLDTRVEAILPALSRERITVLMQRLGRGLGYKPPRGPLFSVLHGPDFKEDVLYDGSGQPITGGTVQTELEQGPGGLSDEQLISLWERLFYLYHNLSIAENLLSRIVEDLKIMSPVIEAASMLPETLRGTSAWMETVYTTMMAQRLDWGSYADTTMERLMRGISFAKSLATTVATDVIARAIVLKTVARNAETARMRIVPALAALREAATKFYASILASGRHVYHDGTEKALLPVFRFVAAQSPFESASGGAASSTGSPKLPVSWARAPVHATATAAAAAAPTGRSPKPLVQPSIPLPGDDNPQPLYPGNQLAYDSLRPVTSAPSPIVIDTESDSEPEGKESAPSVLNDGYAPSSMSAGTLQRAASMLYPQFHGHLSVLVACYAPVTEDLLRETGQAAMRFLRWLEALDTGLAKGQKAFIDFVSAHRALLACIFNAMIDTDMLVRTMRWRTLIERTRDVREMTISSRENALIQMIANGDPAALVEVQLQEPPSTERRDTRVALAHTERSLVHAMRVLLIAAARTLIAETVAADAALLNRSADAESWITLVLMDGQLALAYALGDALPASVVVKRANAISTAVRTVASSDDGVARCVHCLCDNVSTGAHASMNASETAALRMPYTAFYVLELVRLAQPSADSPVAYRGVNDHRPVFDSRLEGWPCVRWFETLPCPSVRVSPGAAVTEQPASGPRQAGTAPLRVRLPALAPLAALPKPRATPYGAGKKLFAGDELKERKLEPIVDLLDRAMCTGDVSTAWQALVATARFPPTSMEMGTVARALLVIARGLGNTDLRLRKYATTDQDLCLETIAAMLRRVTTDDQLDAARYEQWRSYDITNKRARARGKTVYSVAGLYADLATVAEKITAPGNGSDLTRHISSIDPFDARRPKAPSLQDGKSVAPFPFGALRERRLDPEAANIELPATHAELQDIVDRISETARLYPAGMHARLSS